LRKNILRGILYLCISIIVFQINGCNQSNPIQPESGNVIPLVSGNIANIWGEVRAGVKVSTDSATTFTDAQGNFTFTNVSSPYNLYIVDTVSKGSYLLSELTNPEFRFFLKLTPSSSFTNQCKLTLTLSNNAVLQDVKTKFIFTDGNYLNAYSGATGLSESVRLRNFSSVTGTVHLIGYKVDQNGNIMSYENYGNKPATLTTGGDVIVNFDSTDIAFNPSENTISGNYTNTTNNSDLGLMTFNFSEYDTPNYASIISFGSFINNSSFNYVVPDNIPGNLKVRMYYHTSGLQSKRWTVINPGTSGITLEMPTTATIIEPGPGAVVTTSTNFKFTEVSGNGFYSIRIYNAENEYRFLTSKTEFTLNDFAMLNSILIGMITDSPLPGTKTGSAIFP